MVPFLIWTKSYNNKLEMGHSSNKDSKNGVLSVLRLVVTGTLKLLFLFAALILGIAGVICTKISETIKAICEK